MDNDELIMGARAPPKKLENEILDIVKEYSIDNFEMFLIKNGNFDFITKSCCTSEITHLKIRLNLWRVLLKIIPLENELEIRESIEKSRSLYYKEFENFKPQKNIKDDPLLSNPLAKTGPYKNFFEDSELRSMIKKDVDRTYQDKEMFQTLKIKNILTNVLFVWSKLNPDISYRQGMNEIAAVALIVFFTESVNQNDPIEVDSHEIKEETINLFKFLNDENHAEPDIFTIFDKMMKIGHQEMFRPNNEDPKAKKQPINPLRPLKNEVRKMSPILGRCTEMYELSLPIVDKELYKHLKYNNLEPHIFLLRWIRCMLTREFHLIDALSLWDSILCEYYMDSENNRFFLLDCICLAMITYVRAELLTKLDDSSCLQRLLKFPPVENVITILDIAWKFRNQLKSQEKKEDNNNLSENNEKQEKTENKSKNNLIIFNSGLTYKNPQISSKTDRFEEKNENYPTIIEKKSKVLLIDNKSNSHTTQTHEKHERPKSQNSIQKEEISSLSSKEQSSKTRHLIFPEHDEKKSPEKAFFVKNENKKHVEKNTNIKEINEIPLTTNKESLLERLKFINGQIQESVENLSKEEENKNSIIIKEEIQRLKSMKNMVTDCIDLMIPKEIKKNIINEKKEDNNNSNSPDKGGFYLKKTLKENEKNLTLARDPLLKKKI